MKVSKISFRYVVYLTILLLMFSAIVTSCSMDEKNAKISGRVMCQGDGLQAVVVTDGFTCVTTDAKGKYDLQLHPDAEFVYVSIPSGYEADLDRSSPVFYKKLDKKLKKYDFSLNKIAKDVNEFRFLVEADVQASSGDHWDKYEVFSQDIKKFIAEHSEKYLFSLNAGDLLWDDPVTYYDRYMDIASSFGIPQYRTVGNHDMSYGRRSYEQSCEAFRGHYGPEYFSFNVGKAHFIVLDNCFYLGRGINYIGYISENQFLWLEQDLQYIPEGSLVFVLAHIPFRLTNEEKAFKYDARTVESQTTNCAHLFKMLDKYKVHYITGHMHTNSNMIFASNQMEHNTGAVCGLWWRADVCADGTPQGYGVYDVSGDDVSWYYKSYGKDKDYQMRTYSIGACSERPGEFVANVWNYDPEWKVEWLENGRLMGQMIRFDGVDPYVKSLPREEMVPWMSYQSNSHMFAAKPKNKNAKIEVRVTDRFGNIYVQPVGLN